MVDAKIQRDLLGVLESMSLISSDACSGLPMVFRELLDPESRVAN